VHPVLCEGTILRWIQRWRVPRWRHLHCRIRFACWRCLAIILQIQRRPNTWAVSTDLMLRMRRQRWRQRQRTARIRQTLIHQPFQRAPNGVFCRAEWRALSQSCRRWSEGRTRIVCRSRTLRGLPCVQCVRRCSRRIGPESGSSSARCSRTAKRCPPTLWRPCY